MTTVYASAGGERYHASWDCQSMWAARQFWRFDPMQWVPGMPQVMLTDGHDVRPTTPTEALAGGKFPCRACYPAAVDLGPSKDDFGHEPVSGISPNSTHDTVCGRCTVPGHFFSRAGDTLEPSHTPWPCTTAVVLGLAARSAA